MKKILYVMDCNIFGLGGSEKSTLSLINGFKKENEVFVLSQDKNESYKNIDNVNYYFYKKVNNRLFNYIYKMKYFKKIYKLYNFDIINIQNPRFFIAIGLLLKLKLIKNKSKFIYTDRNLFIKYTAFHRFLFKLISKKFDYVVCTTEYNANNWKKICNNVIVINNSIEDNWFEKKNNNIINDKFIIGFCGRFTKFKRWDIALDICKSLINIDNIQFKFAISINKNDENYSIYKSELLNILNDKVIILENISGKELIDFYDSCDIFVLTSDFEPFGRTLIEAMARGCIVFGTNKGGVPEVIPEEYLFDNSDIEKLVRKIIELSSKEKKNIEIIKSNMRLFAKSRYETSLMILKYNELYSR